MSLCFIACLRVLSFAPGMQIMFKVVNMLCWVIKVSRCLPLESDAVIICSHMSER